MDQRLERATFAEEAVAKAMQGQNWRILARNFRHTGFELDIVAIKGSTLVTVEVKYRRRLDLHTLEALLPRKKYDALHRGLLHFAGRHAVRVRTLRIDLALVLQTHEKAPLTFKYWAGISRDECK